MVDERTLLTLFLAAVCEEEGALGAYADRLEETGRPLAVIAREMANAKPNLPPNPRWLRRPRGLASGTGWRIEYAPPWDYDGVAEVRAAYDEVGAWREVEGVETQAAPLGVRRNAAAVRTYKSRVTPGWLAIAFRCDRLNILGYLVAGCPVVSMPSTPFPLAGSRRLRPHVLYLQARLESFNRGGADG
jgi:hypothetical protein